MAAGGPLAAETTLPRATCGVGYSFLHRVVDNCSRVAYSEAIDDETKETVTRFWGRARRLYAGCGITIDRMMTDDGSISQARLLAKTLDARNVKQILARPYRPLTNGEVRRFNPTPTA